jgi:nitric oxide reductase NorD protein
MTKTIDARTAPRHSARLRDADVLDALEEAAVHEHTRHALALYYRALCGRVCSLVPYDDGSSPWEHADTETTVWLPTRAPLDDHADFTADEWYQVAMTHRAMHQRLGTFDLDLDRDEPLFRRLRPVSADDPGVSALERVAALFGHSVLGVHIFATCEDLRIDAATDRLYPGLARVARGVHHGALHERPQPATLFPRAAAIEALVRLSLGGSLVLAAAVMEEPIARITAIARLLRDPRATAESSVEAALRICDVLADLPTEGAHRAVHELRFDDAVGDPEDPRIDVATLPRRLAGAEGFGGWYVPVAYRDWPGPRYVGEQAADLSLADLLPQVAQRSTARAHADDSGDEDTGETTRRQQPPLSDDATPSACSDLTPDMRPATPLPGAADLFSLSTAALAARAPNEFIYPEWDVYAGRYLPDFTRVRVLPAPAHRSDHRHYRALARYGHVVARMVRSLERVRSDGRTVTRRAVAGDDLDLDGCVDAMIDLRAGVEPGDRLFTDLRHPLRQVAVAFAIDLSGSTAIALPPDPEAPGTVRRVLDLQRDAVSLVAQALDRIGDEYGIYGFSGSGRDDVRLSVVKDVEERHTRTVWQRLGGLVPDHTTRMGPAIRHLARRLEAVDAATRLLIVISDGRPFDIDYGQQYGDEGILTYAVGDTAKALDEARTSGVHPYLITVDPDGDDYLAGACDPRGYHVIAEATDLPEALAELYVAVRQHATTARPGRARGHEGPV